MGRLSARRFAATSFLTVSALMALVACGSSSPAPRRSAPQQNWGYAPQRYPNGQYAPPRAPPPPAAPPYAYAPPSNYFLPPAPPPPPKPAPAIPLPPGWTTIGGVPVPTLQALTLPSNIPLPTGWQVPTLESLTGKHCGVAKLRGKNTPLDCMTPAYGQIPWAQFAVVKHGFIDGATTLPTIVDHRIGNLEGPVRDQGPTSTCTAMSFAAAVDHAVGRVNGQQAVVSALNVWANYHTPIMSRAASGNRSHKLTAERSWQYDGRTACSWMTPCDPGDCNAGIQCGTQPPAARIAKAEEEAVALVTNVTALDVNDVDSFRAVLAKGQDIWFAMFVDDAFTELQGRDVVVPDGDFTNAASGHAMLIAGYKTQQNGTYYLLHNSWGTDWGDGGYAWIHANTLRRNIRSAYVVEAKSTAAAPTPARPNPAPTPAPPVQAIPEPPPPPPGGRAACQQGLPDSVTGECVPQCADGSPRANGVCASPTGCAPGQINLFGLCVLGATPKPPTVDPQSGVKVMCAPGGCTYFISYGQLGCQQFLCTQSCPSPKTVLANGPNGLSCTE